MQRVRVSAAMVGGGGRRASMGPTRLAGLDGLGWLEPWYDADEAAGALSEYRNCEVAVQRAPLRSESFE